LYILPSNFLARALLGSQLEEILDDFFLGRDKISQVLVAVNKDHNPLLYYIGIERVLLIVLESIDYLDEGTDSNLSILILNVNDLLEEQKELAISLRLEIF
jgi:hypothetical protein